MQIGLCQNFTNNKNDSTVSLCKTTRRNAILNKKNIDAVFLRYCLAWIRHQDHFTVGQPRNRWQTLAEPLGSTEPRLKIAVTDRVIDWQVNFLGVFVSVAALAWPNEGRQETSAR